MSAAGANWIHLGVVARALVLGAVRVGVGRRERLLMGCEL